VHDVTWRTTAATAVRVLRQLRRDPRTLALLLLLPSVLLTLVRYAFDARPEIFQRTGLPLIGIFPLVSMFLVASIAMLRERRSGTLERLMALPVTKLGLLLGYAIAFAAVAATQSLLTLFVGVGLLGLDVVGPIWLAILVAVSNALLGMAMGLSTSAFASTEFQAIQFMPAFVLPQFLLCGLLVDRSDMAPALELLSYVMPVTYAYDALRGVADRSGVHAAELRDLAITAAMTVLALLAGAATLRRRTP
jgi:ABC-2 type transport system permease protein